MRPEPKVGDIVIICSPVGKYPFYGERFVVERIYCKHCHQYPYHLVMERSPNQWFITSRERFYIVQEKPDGLP